MIRFSRRTLLKLGGVAGASLATTLLRPSPARGKGGPVRRVIVIDAIGGVRWNATFDGQTNPRQNPWGQLDWKVVGRGAAPQWGFSRMLLQRPLPTSVVGWSDKVLPYLSKGDPAFYNTIQPELSQPSWKSALLPTLADIANDIAVVRVTANPGGTFDQDHASAQRTLRTGFAGGATGLVTAFKYSLQQQLGAAFDAAYGLGAVSIGQALWSLGAGKYSTARPIFLSSPTDLPTVDSTGTTSAWGRKLEARLDNAFALTRPADATLAVADYINDKNGADRHTGSLVDPSLVFSAQGPMTQALGTLTDGSTPVTNDMLGEVFGLSSSLAPADDILFDVYGALKGNGKPSWSPTPKSFELHGAVAVRLLQLGAAVVSLSLGAFDTHATEVVGLGAVPQTTQVVALGRLLCALNFALKNIADPGGPPGSSLWDTTVVVVCSEFGRGGANINDTGFNGVTEAAGSDHDEWSAWPIMGGPVNEGGKLLSDAATSHGYYHQNRIFSSILEGMGVTEANSPYLPYSLFPRIEGLLT